MIYVNQALESLNKKDMTEIKSYAKPPTLVEKVMEAVMILRGQEPTWMEAKRQLGKQTHFSTTSHPQLAACLFLVAMLLTVNHTHSLLNTT